MILQGLLEDLELEVPAEALVLLEQLTDELLRWTRRRNLTAITERGDVLEKHIADSLTLLPFARQATRLLDLGSGAGFPSLPLKIACPELEVVSVDSVGKKVDFQKHVVRTLGLRKFTALHSRIEVLQESDDLRAGFDLLTARALCSLSDLVALAEPFLAPGGRLVAMKGPEGKSECLQQQEGLERDGWSISLYHSSLPRSGSERCLIVLGKQ